MPETNGRSLEEIEEEFRSKYEKKSNITTINKAQ
jgi:major inositol transporter-like SP family MFS transporter